MSMCILCAVIEIHAPSYKMASISDFLEARPDTCWFDLGTSVFHWMWSFQTMDNFGWGVATEICRPNKTCYTVRELWHYLRMGKIITFMKSTWNDWNSKQIGKDFWQTPLSMCQVVKMQFLTQKVHSNIIFLEIFFFENRIVFGHI